MGIKISELTSATSLTGSEELPIVQAGNTKKSTISQVKADNYSTTEQVVGTWTNGKPLYRKVVEGSAPTTTTMGTVATGFIYLPEEIEYAFIESAYIDRTADATTPQINPMPVISWTSNVLVRTMCNIVFYNATGMATGTTRAVRIYNSDTGLNSSTKIVAIVCYTKTTDTATRGGEQLRSMNTGSLVGSGEKGNLLLEEIEEKEANEKEEPLPEEVEPNETKAEGSGDER